MRRAADLMRPDVITLAPDDALATAGELMRLGRLRQLPVVARQRVVGELSYRDALAAYGSALGGEAPDEALEDLAALPVERLMRPATDLAEPSATLPEVAAQIARRGAGFVPVVAYEDGGARLLGIVTERDLLRAALQLTPG